MVSGSVDPWAALEGGDPMAYAPGAEDGRDAVKAFVAAVLPALSGEEHVKYASALLKEGFESLAMLHVTEEDLKAAPFTWPTAGEPTPS